MSTSQKLHGKVAIVTGASKGIGAAIARRLAADGANVIVNYLTSEKEAEKVVTEIIHNGGQAKAVRADISKRTEVEQLLQEAVQAFGPIEILVNNAGVYAFKSLEEVTEEHFSQHFNINVLGLILTTQEAVKHFSEDGGSVINLSSVASTATPPGTLIYSGTKGAVDAITKVLAKELASKKIRVNAINPGLIETEGTHRAGLWNSNFHKVIESQTPLGRCGQPSDLVSLAVFLASGDSTWITGENFIVAGGFR